MNIYEKLAEARRVIRESKVKKEGKNSFSGYEYFTPEQVEELVTKACEATKTICLTNLRQDALGYFQTLEFISLEKAMDGNVETGWGERIVFELRTTAPEIKATNAAQQMGGMDTYSERYLKMKVFQIKDNNLDFDAHNNRPALPAKTARSKKATTFDPTEYQLRLESTGSTEELKVVWLSFPPEAKDALAGLKEELKKKYAKAGI
jgi:hypothetical protein